MKWSGKISLALFASAASLAFACGGSDGATPGRGGIDAGAADATDASPTTPPDAGADASADAAADAWPSGPPAIRYIGRFDTRDPAGPQCAWPGCRIIANFTGTEVSAQLDETVESWMQGGPSEWDVIIDGALKPKLVLTTGPQTYKLATGLAPGLHQVELYKRSETQNGYTRFLGYDFGAGGALLGPPPAATRHIEIIGDSAPAAFGVDSMGLGPNCPGVNWASKYENFHESFGALLGATFSADVEGSVYSGKGFVRDIWRPDTETMPTIYARTNPLDATSTYDFSIVPDVIIIMMGGNDFAIGQPVDDGPTPLADFESAYGAFVAMLRSHAPKAHIFLATSPSVSDAEPAGRQSRTSILAAHDVVVAAQAAVGDTRVYAVVPTVATPAELVGCEGHGTPALHQRVAGELAVSLGTKTGW